MSKTFELGDEVKIILTGQKGTVIAYHQRLNVQDQYLVEYVNGNGNVTEDYFFPEKIQAV
jgi:hypothetical protein